MFCLDMNVYKLWQKHQYLWLKNLISMQSIHSLFFIIKSPWLNGWQSKLCWNEISCNHGADDDNADDESRVVLANPSYGAVRLKLWPQWRNLRTIFGRFIIMIIIIIMILWVSPQPDYMAVSLPRISAMLVRYSDQLSTVKLWNWLQRLPSCSRLSNPSFGSPSWCDTKVWSSKDA